MRIKILASGSKGNCYRISDGETSLLLEAGIPIREIQKGCDFRLSGIGGCLVSHEHGDHAKTADTLMKKGIDVYASQGTAAAKGWSGHRLRIVKSMEYFDIGTFTVMPFALEHDAAENMGFFIISRETGERLLYVTDTHYVPYEFDGLTHIMCECNYDHNILSANVRSGRIPHTLATRIIDTHMSIDGFEEMLCEMNLTRVKQIYLLHMSEDNSDAAAFKERVQRLTGAEVYVCY
ncbi:MAG: MBL fold metallo-hydrolase [Defluviitaleaceae bacterium]|nr:MBL fold metallo-hydrolase [Defluviitaleaceae bacterium]